MFEVIFLLVLALIWIIFAVVQDLRTREIANWINFSLIIFAMGFRFFYCLFSDVGFGFFYQGLIGLGVFFILGNVLYYGRFFAGGDAKLMIALGTVLPFSSTFGINLKLFILFVLTFLLAGAIYGLVFSLSLALKNFKDFKKEFIKKLKENKKKFYLIMVLGLILMLLGILESMIFFLGVLIFLLPYLYVFAKAVDDACMIKKIAVKFLREGDWLYKDVRIGSKTIKSNWNGLINKEILQIKKAKKFVGIKQGIAFSPVFLISLLILGYLWKSGLWNSFW